MHITCPNCHRRYAVKDPSFWKAASRVVRCVACHHTWTHVIESAPSKAARVQSKIEGSELPVRKAAQPAHSVSPRPQKKPSPQKRSWRPGLWRGWLAWLAVVGMLGGGYTFFQKELVALWPPLSCIEALRPSIGASLHILELGHHVRLSPEGRKLVMTGVIENGSDQEREVPTLLMRVVMPGQVASESTSDAQAERVDVAEEVLAPGGRVFFESPGIPMPPKGTKVEFVFEGASSTVIPGVSSTVIPGVSSTVIPGPDPGSHDQADHGSIPG